MNKFSVRDKIAATLICCMKHNDEEFIVCKRNDFIISLLDKLEPNPEEFIKKIENLIDQAS